MLAVGLSTPSAKSNDVPRSKGVDSHIAERGSWLQTVGW